MKKFYAIVLTGLAVAGGLWSLQSEEVVADYSPRTQESLATTSVLPQDLFVKLFGNNETGEFDPQDHVRARADIDKRFGKVGEQKNASLDWVEMGPDNIGGRTRGVAFVNEQTVFIGSVSGGLYKSTDGGNNWNKVVSCPAQAISDLEITGNGDLYASTGSAFEGASGIGDSGFPGTGLHRSTDGGSTWTIVEGTQPANFTPGFNWGEISAIEKDPNLPNRLWIAAGGGLGYYDSDSNTLTHPGVGSDELDGLPNNGACEVIEISTDGSVMYASINDDLYRSTDSGNSWGIVADDNGNGEPNDDIDINASGRMSVAISPDNPDVAYVLKASGGGSLRDAYYTTDGGDVWTDMWPNTPEYDLFGDNTQGGYDNCVTVVPGTNGDLAYFGGVTLWRAGVIDQPEQAALNFEIDAPGFENLYVHSDLHTFESLKVAYK